MLYERLPTLQLFVKSPRLPCDFHVTANEIGRDLVALVKCDTIDPGKRKFAQQFGINPSAHFSLISRNRSWRYSSAVIGGHFGCSPGGTVPGSASIRKSERKWRKKGIE